MKNILNSIKNTATGLVESVKSHFVHEVSTPVVEEVVEEVAKKNGLKAAVNTAKAVVTAHPVATIAVASVVVLGITAIAVVSHKKKKANNVVKADEKVDTNTKSNAVDELLSSDSSDTSTEDNEVNEDNEAASDCPDTSTEDNEINDGTCVDDEEETVNIEDEDIEDCSKSSSESNNNR